MSALPSLPIVSIDDYLAGERVSTVRHEYLGGIVYAMAGARNDHNTIATNALISTGGQLRGKPCQAFNSDTKVRVRLTTHTRFYYPDAMIVCEPNPAGDTFQDRPVVIAEVLSDATRRADEGEKRDAYLAIPTLSVYLLIDAERPRVVAYERAAAGGFVARAYEGLDAIVPLPDAGVSLPLADLYARITFPLADADPPRANAS